MAGVKITDLTPITSAASDDLLYIVDVSDNTSGPQGTSKAIEVGDLRGYKVYTALLTQSGTDAPTAIVLENTIGNIVWTRQAAGDYIATLSNAFVLNKTICLAYANQIDSQGVPYLYYFERINISSLSLQTGNSNTTSNEDGLIINIPFEIRVYN